MILPTCEKAYPGSRSGLCRLARAAARDDDYLSRVTDEAAHKCLYDYPGGQYICTDIFAGLHPAIQARIAARAMRRTGNDPDQAGIDRILDALKGRNANLTGDIRVSLGSSRIYLEHAGNGRGGRLMDALDESSGVPQGDLPLRIENSLGALVIERVVRDKNGMLPLGDGHWQQAIDMDALRDVQLRFRRAGDKIWPLGAPGEKKLKDFYIDKKIDRQVRGFLPVLARGNRVIWALGVGAGCECAITQDSQNIAFMRWHGLKFWR